ncbi:MAG: CPBP family intramembrane metalloprotease [Mitsuaria chitosanitabida]|uniref:CPBP family intramembrane glutamic endopeptidase n=1 Tax=Roseateles chitosanitabidus TaxID=65048 RepID=UPI001B060C5C|nr:CPBP family intramembrane glutamic endopeptidase [Roseateles chitosanitabidus]MBO9685418.1 CPBP family intramembrane metalloprotease [Roseateles chitosanitabidus]
MPLSHLLLCLSIAMTLLPVTAPWPWLATLIMAVTAGQVNGQLGIAALAPIGAMAALAWMTIAAAGRPRRELALMLLMLVLGLALSLHLLPGFLNPTYLVSASDQRAPTLKYLNFDKGVAGLLMLAVLATQQRRVRVASATALSRLAQRTGTPPWALPAVIVATLAVPWLLAVASGIGQPTLRWPDNAGLFLTANLFLTCVAEEAAFRGVVQGLLARRLGTDLRTARGWLPVLVAALLFGAAHAAGGIAYVGLATLAGLGYGLAYALTRRIEVAIGLHVALNALVFTTLNLRVG